MLESRRLVVCMTEENTNWGDSHLQCALKDNGIKPAPDRPSSWKSFLKAHWGELAATDFFTTEVWTPYGLVTDYTLFLIDLKTRRVHIAGSTPQPNEAFIAQVARNLTDTLDGFLLPHRFLICDRDSKFGKRSLQRAIREYVGHYHMERPHQSPGNEVIERDNRRPTSQTEARCEERLGGLLKHYRRAAWRWDSTSLWPITPRSVASSRS
jgi:putative transposase